MSVADPFAELIDCTNWTEDDWVAHDKARWPHNRRIVKRGERDWSESNVYKDADGRDFTMTCACHDVELECGHHTVYRHTGILFPTIECPTCKAAAEASP